MNSTNPGNGKLCDFLKSSQFSYGAVATIDQDSKHFKGGAAGEDLMSLVSEVITPQIPTASASSKINTRSQVNPR